MRMNENVSPPAMVTDAAWADSEYLQRYRASSGEEAGLVLHAADWVHLHAPDQALRIPALLEFSGRLSADPVAVSALILYLGVHQDESFKTEILTAFPESVRLLLASLIQLREFGAKLEANDRQHYPVDIRISAYERKNLQKDISAILSNEHASITAMRVHETGTGLQDIRLTLRIQDYEQLSALLARISGLPNVLDACRIH